jgi:hypothetical protein
MGSWIIGVPRVNRLKGDTLSKDSCRLHSSWIPEFEQVFKAKGFGSKTIGWPSVTGSCLVLRPEAGAEADSKRAPNEKRLNTKKAG